jgi:HEAT repeat protein
MRQQLVEIVRNQNLPIDLRDSAATILAAAEQEDIVEPLLDLLIDPGVDSEGRRFAAYVLGSLKEPRAMKRLVPLLTDPEVNVRGAAARALGKIGDPFAVEALIELLADQSSYQEVKGTLLKNEERFLQMTVARALGQIGDVRAIEPLWTTFGQGLMYTYEPLRALAWLGDQRAYEPLLFRLRSSGSMSILEIDEMTKALVRLAGHDAIEPLDQMLCDPSLSYWIRTACIDALVQLWTILENSLALHNLQWFASRQEETPERHYARKVLAELGLFPQREKEDDHA